jgi:Ca-activated chloride channel family protein
VETSVLKDARRYVDRLSADGWTDLEAALQAGLGIFARSEKRGASRLIVFLTDGLPTAGITDEHTIAHRVTRTNAHLEARLHVFGVGYDVNTHLLDGLAADNAGTVTYVQPGENLKVALTEFYGKIAHPVLTDVKISFKGLRVSDLYPQTVPDMFQGSSLLLTGRYRATGDTVTVQVRGRAGDEGREYVYHFDLDQTGNHHFVPRLWATRQIGALLDRVRVEGESQALVDEIQELGLGYGLVTPYTTFVIEGQAEGAASAANMALYDLAEVNKASGQTTIMARVQNQAYQEAAQADLAVGANVLSSGQRSMAQVGTQVVDLSLLQGQKALDGPITPGWVERYVGIDLTVEFGSEEYFALAEDPAVRPFLQGGSNVIFAHQGQVISVEDQEDRYERFDGPSILNDPSTLGPDSGKHGHRSGTADTSGALMSNSGVRPAMALLSSLVSLTAYTAAVMLIGLAVAAATICYFLKPRTR